MSEADLRPYVERLLRGEFNLGEVMQLLLYARERSEGRHSVKEIGDFIAHINERQRGAVVQEARNFFSFLRFRAQHPRSRIGLNSLPADTPSILRESMRRAEPAHLKKLTRLNKSQARTALEGFLGKLEFKNIGLLALTSNPTDTENLVFKFLYNTITAIPVFTGKELFDGVSAILKNNQLLHRSEVRSFEKVRPGIILYAVSVMHRSRIDLGAGEKGYLLANKGPNDILEVLATGPKIHPIGMNSGRPFIYAHPMFDTTLKAKDHCDEALLRDNRWLFPLEVTPTQILRQRA
jgi:hypothetical protein